ncbi:MAG: winged helix-turn-helix transcriptional regulator [Candidatus Poribacteria bacterium]
MKSAFISRFTPSLMKYEDLEAIFVQRESIANRIVELIRDSVITPTKHHILLIGPRGIGKTHLIAIVYHRIKKMDDLQDRLLIAWLREEEWGVTSFLDLLMRIFRALLDEYDDQWLKDQVESLYGLSLDLAENKAKTLLKDFVGGRTLFLIMENLSDLFNGLSNRGQKQLRAYLQENPFCTILATSQSLFNGISLQTSPFYGFFSINHLDELDLDNAVEMLAKIAHLNEDDELESFIKTPTGKSRIRALHHLAGGNNRVYVIFSQFINREMLDELVESVMKTLDDLTPYYQARMMHLSQQQRKIVEFLCDRRGAVKVKEIAEKCFLSHQVTSSQLKALKDMGYVRPDTVGRESYYELREPLMRLCSEVKKQRGEPIRLLVDFLRIWFSRPELANDKAIKLYPDSSFSWVDRGLTLLGIKRFDEAYASLSKAIELGFKTPGVFLLLAEATLAMNRWDEGIKALEFVFTRFPEDKIIVDFETRKMLNNLFESTLDKNIWQDRIVKLINLYSKHKLLSLLGRGLTRSISTIYSSTMVSDTAIQIWLDVWQKVGKSYPELHIPLRLLDSAVRYRKSKDKRVLLELPVEEREILEPLLGIKETV